MVSLELDEITKQECEADKTLCFMSMPIWKFVVLNILSLGMYYIVWYYKYWCTVRDNYKIKINPVFRTLFLIFTCHRLFTIINKHLKRFSLSISPLVLTIVLIISNFLARLDGTIGWIMLILVWVPSIIIQIKINKINKENHPQAENNVWTWKTTGFLVLYWFVLIVGTIIYSILTYSK